MHLTRHAEALAVLADPRYVPPPVRQDAPEGTLAWLRAHVSRFSSGAEHAARRRSVVERLAALDPVRLRADARRATLERAGDWRGVPTRVLGAALGVADTAPVAAAAAGYLSGEESPQRDAAVAALLDRADLPAVTLLLQAHDATETLIANALPRLAGHDDVEAVLRETLRHDPPVKVLRRLDLRDEEEVTLDVVAANRDPDVFPDPGRFDPARGDGPHLTFGAGLRPCPAPAYALALAAGVLEGLRAGERP
ncbi:cytochrome P450 [Nonomuraea coxensis]|nr:cytochrome P450 [Nonomuraea coxensis]